MTLSDETIRLVRASGALLPVGDPAPVHAFYARLFELAPEVRPLFAPTLDMQVGKLPTCSRGSSPTSKSPRR